MSFESLCEACALRVLQPQTSPQQKSASKNAVQPKHGEYNMPQHFPPSFMPHHASPKVFSATLKRNLAMSCSREEYDGSTRWLLHVLHVTSRLKNGEK